MAPNRPGVGSVGVGRLLPIRGRALARADGARSAGLRSCVRMDRGWPVRAGDAHLALACLADAWIYGERVPHALTKWERRAYEHAAVTMHRRGMLMAAGVRWDDPQILAPVPYPPAE